MSVQSELASLQRINDRLISTSNEDLQRVLANLLPKLLPLSNNDDLRDKQVIPIFMQVLKRIKLLETILPLRDLVSLIRPDMLPFCCNLSMMFIDAAKKWHPAEQWSECAVPLVFGLGEFKSFSSQSNALCFYSLSCLGSISTLMTSEPESSARSVLADWLLDLSLAQPGIVKDSAGSIQPGLSAERLARLTAKKSVWSVLDMKQYKLDLISSLSKQWLPTPCAVAITIVLSCDSDPDVVTQATFKMNGARSILPDINANPLPVLELLLTLCLPVTHGTQKNNGNLIIRQRTTLRTSVKCTILRWICKEMQGTIVIAAKCVVELVVVEMMKSSDVGVTDAAYSSQIMELTAILVEKLADSDLQAVAGILLRCAKKALWPFVSLLSSKSSSSIDSEAGIFTRESCYRIVDKISRSCPALAASDSELLGLLFRLLDCEDNRAVIRLYTALGGLRLAYQGHYSGDTAEAIDRERSTHVTQGTSESGSRGSGGTSLLELISRSRTSSEPKKRLAAVQWARALFNWNPMVIETMILLADDLNESVSKAVAGEFISLRGAIADGTSSSTSPIEENSLCDSQSNDDTRLVGDLKLLKNVLELISSPLLSYPLEPSSTEKKEVHHKNSMNTEEERDKSEIKLRSIACEELLHTAAAGVKSLVSKALKYNFDGQFFLQPDPWSVISMGSMECDAVSSELLCEVIASVGKILESTQLTSKKSSGSHSVAKGALWTKLAAADALRESQARSILAASSDLLHKCLLCTSDASVLQFSQTLMPKLLSLLSECYSNPADPFSLAFVTTYLPATTAAVDQSSSEKERDTTDGARRSGCFRTHLSQTIAMTCQNADENFMSNLFRVLNHKLSKLSGKAESSLEEDPTPLSTSRQQTSARSLVEDDLIVIAGSISALGSISEALASWRTLGIAKDENTHTTESAIERSCNQQVLDAVISILNLPAVSSELAQLPSTIGAPKESTVARNPYVDLKIVALRVLKGLAANGVFSYATRISYPVGSPSSSTVPFDEATREQRLTVLSTLSNIVGAYATRDSSGATRGAINGRSSAYSKIVAAAVDVLGTACLAGVTEEFFWATCEMLMSFRPSRDETPLLRFALAEGLVRMSAVSAPHQSACPFTVSSRSAAQGAVTQPLDGESFGSENLPVLTRVLLGIIETAVANGTSSSPSFETTSQLPGGARPPGTLDKSTAGVLLLVLVKQSGSNLLSSTVYRTSQSNTVLPKLKALPKKEVIRTTELFLQLLREKDAFLQDMSCAGLCYLFNRACEFDKNLAVSPGLLENDCDTTDFKGILLSEIVGREVIATLTRAKRGPQAAGVAVAGEATSTSSAGDMARALDAVLNPQPQEEGETERRAPANGGRGGGGAGGGGAVAGGGGGGAPAPVDPMAAATAAAALEFGLSPEATAALTRHGARSDDSDNGFGVYTTACKVAKKTGDSSVVFAVLALIQRDPSFGIGESSLLRFTYQSPSVHIDKKKIKDLLPSLFLAKYDPSPPIRALMKQLWHTLITSQGHQKLLVVLQNEVIKYLCVSLNSKQWREREAACCALEAFLPLRPWAVVRALGDDLWSSGMSVLDDVRDSTRIAAVGLMKALSDQVTRACNPEESGSSSDIVDDAIAFILPILLDKGLVAPSQEARGFTLGVLLRLIKSSRSALKEWLVRLVAVLVESMSALEPKTLQYMQFHTARLQINDEELENMRVRLSRQSPMQEALDACLQALAGRPLDVPPAALALRTQLQCGVGLATRVAAVQSLSYLAETFPGEIGSSEHGSKTFRTIVDSLINSPQMAVTLQKALLGGLGSLAKVVNAELLASVCEELISRYEALGRDDGSEAPVIASCLFQIVTRAGDRLLDDCAWSRLLACTYVGTSDTSREAQEVWTKLWPEVLSGSTTGTKTAALLRVLPIIVNLVVVLLSDLSWDKRKQAVAVIADLTVSLSSSQLSPCMGGVVEALLGCISGRIWTGQAEALETLSAVVSKCYPVAVTNLHAKHSPSSDNCGDSGKNRVTEQTREHPSGDSRDVAFNLDKTIVKKPSIMSVTDSMHLDTAAITLSIDLSENDNSNTITSRCTDSLPEDKNIHVLRLSLQGLITLLLHEAQRGDREYRLSAARALSTLPWTAMSSVPEGRRIFSLFVSEFARLGGVTPRPAKSDEASEAANSSIVKSLTTVSDKVDIKDERRKRQQTNSAMFGSRYGIDFKEKKRYNGASTASFPVTVASDSVLHSDSTIGDIDTDMETGAMSNNQDDADQQNSTSVPELEEIESTFTGLIPLQEGGEGSQEVDATTFPAKSASTGLSFQDPAYRAKMMECISLGWPLIIDGTEISDILWTQQIEGRSDVRVDGLVTWASAIMNSGEVWSICVSALQILGVVLSVWQGVGRVENECNSVLSSSDSDLFMAAIQIITVAMNDRKHSKVRIAALICLDKILAGASSRTYLMDKDEVRMVLRLAASDMEPAVLEAASRAQKSWLALVTLKVSSATVVA